MSRHMIDEIYPLYLQVHDRSKLNFEKLTPEYFCRSRPARCRSGRGFSSGGRRARRSPSVFASCTTGRSTTITSGSIIASRSIFISISTPCATSSAGRWRRVSHSYCSSPLNYDPKLHLGCELVPLDLYVMHTGAWLNPIFRHALSFLEPTRHDPVLRQFRQRARTLDACRPRHFEAQVVIGSARRWFVNPWLQLAHLRRSSARPLIFSSSSARKRPPTRRTPGRGPVLPGCARRGSGGEFSLPSSASLAGSPPCVTSPLDRFSGRPGRARSRSAELLDFSWGE